jgi:hypothetical protein
MKRPQDWPTRLALFIEEKRHQTFNWKENNCAFFASDWIAILTGEDPASEYRSKVDSPLSAARALGDVTVEQVAERVCAEHGWPEVSPKLARRGDVVLRDTEHRPAMGVCEGERAVFAAPDGLAFLPAAQCRRAWRIA